MAKVYPAKLIPINSFVYTVCDIPKGYLVIKWDGLLNIERMYCLKGEIGGRISCPCPNRHWANNPCRHREIVWEMYFLGRIGRGWFYDYDHNKWYLPLNLGEQ